MKLSLYFLFYVAMVLELLIFIVDRDDAEERVALATKTMLEQMTSVDTVKVFGTLGFKLGGNDTTSLAFHTFSLLSDSERANVKYNIKRRYYYGDKLIAETANTTRLDGARDSVTDDLRAEVVDPDSRKSHEKRGSVKVIFWRDSVSGDPSLTIIHSVPGVLAEQLLHGKAEIEVEPVLKRSFPEAFRKNPTVVSFLKSRWIIPDMDNYMPKCIPWTTTIEFRPTTGAIWSGEGSKN